MNDRWSTCDLRHVANFRRMIDYDSLPHIEYYHLLTTKPVHGQYSISGEILYYHGEPREALKLNKEDCGIIICPEKRTAPSRAGSYF